MIRRPDGKLKGYNVDYLGAIAAIEEGLRGLHYITSYAMFYLTFSWISLMNQIFIHSIKWRKQWIWFPIGW